MRALALTVGYVMLLGGMGAACYTGLTHWTREEDDPLLKYRFEIMFFGLLAATLGTAILILNGENVPILFRSRYSPTP